MKIYKPLSFKTKHDYTLPCKSVKFTNQLALIKLGLIEDPAKDADRYDTFAIHRQLQCKEATVEVEVIDEKHHYNRYKKFFLEMNAYKTHDGYILPNDKVSEFLSNDFIPESREINVSVSQPRIAKTGQDKAKYIAYAGDDGLCICPKSEYNSHDHYGKYVLINVTRPYIMWGTVEEIEEDIKGIIYDELKENGLFDFLGS